MTYTRAGYLLTFVGGALAIGTMLTTNIRWRVLLGLALMIAGSLCFIRAKRKP
jgi:hypothetical protein